MTQREYEKRVEKIKARNKDIEMKQNLKAAKIKRFNWKKPRTSKMVLWTVIIICIQILWFTEHMATITGDTSFMYALIAIPASLIPTVLSYMKNSRVEHQMGQFEYPIETPSNNTDETDNPVG